MVYDEALSTKITTIAQGSTGNVEVWAKWTPVVYNITYNLNSGTNGANPETYTIETATITFANATKTGYTFNGWFSDEQLSTAITTIAQGSTGNVEVWAKWTANTDTAYTIKFYKQKLAVSTEYEYIATDDIALTGTTDTLTTIEKDSNGITDSKYAGFSVGNIENVNIASDGSAEVKVYYTRNLYDISINVNDTSCGNVDKVLVENVPYGTVISVNGNILNVNGINVTATKENATAQYTYAFTGWTNGDITVDGNESITANFTKITNSYTITWKNGTQTLELDENVNYGTTPQYNGATPTKASLDSTYRWEFKAWTPNIVNVVGNATYTATFEKISLVITTPDIDPTNPDNEDMVESEIDIENGVTGDVGFILKEKDKSLLNSNIKAPQNQEIIKSYNAQLLENDIEITDDLGKLTIKMAVPVELYGRQNIQIVIMDNETNTPVIKTATIEGDYLTFETISLGDFAIVADVESNSLWIIIVCVGAVLIALLILWIFVFKRNLTFIIDGRKITTIKFKRGQELKFPLNLARYKWFMDQEQTKLLTKQKMGWFGFKVYTKQNKTNLQNTNKH